MDVMASTTEGLTMERCRKNLKENKRSRDKRYSDSEFFLCNHYHALQLSLFLRKGRERTRRTLLGSLKTNSDHIIGGGVGGGGEKSQNKTLV